MKPGDGVLNLSDEPGCFPLTRLSGPGLRYALFVQGCPLRCTGRCLNPENLAQVERVLVPVEAVAAHVLALAARYALEGITLLGGEPFAQAPALARLAAAVRQRGLTVVTYTGYTLEALHARPEPGWAELAAASDILVEGPFRESECSTRLLWRGSRNQRIVLLSGRYLPAELAGQCIEWREAAAGAVRLPAPRLERFEGRGCSELHWSYLKPLERWCRGSGRGGPASQAVAGGVAWWPERERQASVGLIPYGLIIVVGRERTLLYGTHDEADLQRFQATLEPLGIRLPGGLEASCGNRTGAGGPTE